VFPTNIDHFSRFELHSDTVTQSSAEVMGSLRQLSSFWAPLWPKFSRGDGFAASVVVILSSTVTKVQQRWWVRCVSCRHFELRCDQSSAEVMGLLRQLSSVVRQLLLNLFGEVWFCWNLVWVMWGQQAAELQSGCWIFAYIILCGLVMLIRCPQNTAKYLGQQDACWKISNSQDPSMDFNFKFSIHSEHNRCCDAFGYIFCDCLCYQSIYSTLVLIVLIYVVGQHCVLS